MLENARPENPWTDAELDPMRTAGDQLADHVIATLFSESEVGAVNEMMRSLVTNEFPEPAAFPQIVRDYLTDTDRLPAWADSALIEAGEQVFWRYGPKLILIFNCYSLPWDYLGQKRVQLPNHRHGKRSGICPSIRKTWSAPHVVLLDRSGRLGKARRDCQRRRQGSLSALLARNWVIVGHSRRTVADEHRECARSRLVNRAPPVRSHSGSASAHEGIGGHDGKYFAGECLRSCRASADPLFPGKERTNWLGVEAGEILENSRALSALAEKVGHLLIESIVYVERGGNRPSFTIPVELRQQWGVNWLC